MEEKILCVELQVWVKKEREGKKKNKDEFYFVAVVTSPLLPLTLFLIYYSTDLFTEHSGMKDM